MMPVLRLMDRMRWFQTSATYKSPSGPSDIPPGPQRKALVASSPSWTLVPPNRVVTMPVVPSYRRSLPEQSLQYTLSSGSAQIPASQELHVVCEPRTPSSPNPGTPVPTSVLTIPDRASTLRTRNPYFSPT